MGTYRNARAETGRGCGRRGAIRARLLLSMLVAPLTQLACAGEEVQQAFPVGDRYRLVFEGGVRLQKGTFGSSRAAYNMGPLVVSEEQGTVWIAGHAHHFSVGAFELPEPVNSMKLKDYPIAGNRQPFVRIKPPRKLAGKPDRIVGMQLIDGRLFVNTAEYYDADGNNRNTTVIIEDPMNLRGSDQRGWYQMQGRVHAAGWMTPVPDYLQQTLGGPWITGYASNIPVNGRHSIGPTLFIWDPASVATGPAAERRIETSALIDYSLRDPLHHDGYNESGENTLWTDISKAHLGFIVPGTTDYLVIGSSGGHYSGIGYKITQDNGRDCGGACPYGHKDYYNYFWRYELAEVERVLRRELRPHQVRPAEYGELPIFSGRPNRTDLIEGADFSPESGRLYLLVSDVDGTQSEFENQPLLLVYSLWTGVGDTMTPVRAGAGAPPRPTDQAPVLPGPADPGPAPVEGLREAIEQGVYPLFPGGDSGAR